MSGKKFLTKQFTLPIIAILSLISIAIGLFIYRSDLEADLQAANCDTLENVMEQQKFTFASKIEDQKDSIKIYADFFEYASAISEEGLLEKLNVIIENSTFDLITYALPNGDALENTGTRFNVADRDYFSRALAGEMVISGPLTSKVTNTDIVTFATPVFRDGKPAAVLIGVYDAQDLSDLLMPSFSKKGYTYVTTSDGQVIFKTQTTSKLALNSNLFDSMNDAEIYEFDDSAVIRARAAIGDAGHSHYMHDGESRLMHYAPLGINDWYIFSVAPETSINPQSMDIMYNSTLFMFVITILAIAVLLYIFISQRRHVQELSQLAFVDTLTGVANKKKFKLVAAELLADSHDRYAFAILDIDKFKVLNDTLGYNSGDLLLINICRVLQQHLKEKEFFCRCDSDEYYLLLLYTDDKTLRDRILLIMAQIGDEFKDQLDNSYSLVLCAGVYVIANFKESINSIRDKASHAHRLIKGKDESGISFYNEEIRNRILEEKEIENKMHGALQNGEFLLYLQPKYYLESEKIYGAEALVRWDGNSRTLAYPSDFIPIFEKNGFVTKLDMYMLEKACQTIRGWLDSNVVPIPISINFSRLHLKNPRFVDDIADIVDKYRIPPRYIEIELTESTMLHNEEVLIAMLSHLHEHGFTLSMDDFGSGYSSLGLLKNLPVDVIKLDRTFFVNYSELKRAVTVVGSIISMARDLGIKTVAEGVETIEQIEFLRELGCDIVQGYYYAKPMLAIEIDSYLEKVDPLTHGFPTKGAVSENKTRAGAE